MRASIYQRTCVYVPAHAQMCASMYACTNVFLQEREHAHVHTHTRTHTHARTHSHTHTNTYTHRRTGTFLTLGLEDTANVKERLFQVCRV
jgi:hypothetical protein